jgi:hypothetical protein
VLTVVRPDTLKDVPQGLVYLHDLGVRHVNLSLDLWARWTAIDGLGLQLLVDRAAELWRQWLPDFSLNWFDGKVAGPARCGFGEGHIAVAPSGRLYPCERLIGEDPPDNPGRLPGDILKGGDFLSFAPAAMELCPACSGPDGLLDLLHKAAAPVVGRVLEDADEVGSVR